MHARGARARAGAAARGAGAPPDEAMRMDHQCTTALLLALFHAGQYMGLQASTVSSGCRDPLRQPFALSSIWNTPLGSAAQFAPTGMDHFEAAEFHVDGNFVCHCQLILCFCCLPWGVF